MDVHVGDRDNGGELRYNKTDDRPKLFGEYSQDHKPLVEPDEAVGHAVRAMYLYAGAADVATLTGDEELAAAVDRIWENVVDKKTYVTGGIGAKGQGEAFGKNYELPNRTAYCETCANLATCYWNARSKWFDCSCCPTNLCRFIPSVPGYAYAVGDDGPYVNLFVEGKAELDVAGKKVAIEQTTRYPWDGRIEITVTPSAAGEEFALHVRIPGWARGEAWPTDLYSFLDASGEHPTLAPNGESVKFEPVKGDAVIDRAWQAGDTVTLELPMPVRRVIADEKVENDRGRVALLRGPLVFCVEGADVAGGKASDLMLPDDAPLASEFRNDLLGGVQVITGDARRADKTVKLTAIPYYAWANRGKGEMTVWLARTPEALQAKED